MNSFPGIVRYINRPLQSPAFKSLSIQTLRHSLDSVTLTLTLRRLLRYMYQVKTKTTTPYLKPGSRFLTQSRQPLHSTRTRIHQETEPYLWSSSELIDTVALFAGLAGLHQISRSAYLALNGSNPCLVT